MRLIDCANAPIFGINAASLITEWNRKATQITGRSKWEVVGRRCDGRRAPTAHAITRTWPFAALTRAPCGRRLEDFIRLEDRDSVVEVLQNALGGKETANFEFPLYTKSQQRVEILLVRIPSRR
eukprot:4576478-Prymnesium_polylepis.1